MFPLKPAVAGRIAWSIWAVAMVLFVVAGYLFATTPGKPSDAFDPHLLLIPGYVTVGAAIVARRSSNRIGWLFLALGLVSAVESASFNAALHLLTTDRTSGVGRFGAWLGNWEWSASFVLLLY